MKVIPKKAVEWMMMSSENILLEVETCYIRFFFPSKICVHLCKGISWQVNLSRLDFPWILRWCYFNSLSRGCILNFVSCLLPFYISSNVKYPPMSNTACYCKIVKSNIVPPRTGCLFHSKLFSGKLNETWSRSCWKIKKRNGRKSLYWMFPTKADTRPSPL